MLITITFSKSCNHFSLHFLSNSQELHQAFWIQTPSILHQIAQFLLIRALYIFLSNCFEESLPKSSRISTVHHKLNNGELRFLTRGAVLDQATSCIHFPQPSPSSVLDFGTRKRKISSLLHSRYQNSNLTIL